MFFNILQSALRLTAAFVAGLVAKFFFNATLDRFEI